MPPCAHDGLWRTTRQCPVNGCGARAGRPRANGRRNRTAPRPCYRAFKTAKSGRAETCRRLVRRPTIERPQCKPHGFFMKCLRFLTAVTLLAAAAWRPALAADATFPPGVRVGLAPLVGLSRAKSFTGFESEDQSVKVLVTELPPDAYSEVSAAFKANPAGVGGVKPEKIETPAGTAFYAAETAKDGANTVRRYSMILSGGTFSGYVAVQVPDNATKIYSDDAVRQMFASTVTRKVVPVEEQLGLMPPQPDDRGRFAQQSATTIPGVRDARITMSEPIRIDGMPGYETRIDATSGKGNTSVTVVQWLRFGGPHMLRIIGSAPRDQWSAAFPRFRAVRDGIQPRG